MINLDLLTQSVIDRCLARGADAVKCSVSLDEKREFNVDGGRFSLFRTVFEHSLSLTVFKNGRRGSISLGIEEDDIAEAIDDALAAAEVAMPDPAWALCEEPLGYDITDGAPEPDVERLFERTNELKTDIERLYPKLIMEQMIVSHDRTESMMRTSFGGRFHRVSGDYHVSLMFSAHEGETASSFAGADVATVSLDRPFLELGNIKEVLASTEQQLVTTALEGKFKGVMVLVPDALVEFIASALSSFASDSSLIDGTSLWKDALGTLVADPRLTVSSKPHDPRLVGTSFCTSEGFLAEDYDIIKNGVLEQFMLSLYAANKTGGKRAPNDAMDLVIEGGDTPYADLIAGIDRGILVGRFSGGEPNSNGDFSGVAKNSFLIENGKIAGALRETMVNGNLAELFKNIKAISKETVENGGYVLPTIAFNGVTISGQ